METDSTLQLKILQELERRFAEPVVRRTGEILEEKRKAKSNVELPQPTPNDFNGNQNSPITVSQAVMSVFDRLPNTSIKFTILVGLAIQKMDVNPNNVRAVTNSVTDFIREQADIGTLVIKKGRNGGVSRPQR